jgi:hypothetical protein
MLYFNQGSVGGDSRAYFTTEGFTPTIANKIFSAKNSLTPNAYIKGVTSPQYSSSLSGSGRAVYNVFDDTTLNQGNYFTSGGNGAYPFYTVPEEGNYKFTASIDLAITNSTAGVSLGYTLDIIKTNPTVVLASATQTTTNIGQTVDTTTERVYVSCSRTGNDFQGYAYQLPDQLSVYNSAGTSIIQTYPAGGYLYVATGSTTFRFASPNTASIARDMQVVYAYSPTLINSYTASFFTNITGSTSGSTTAITANPDGSTYFFINNALLFSYGGATTGGGPFTSSISPASSTDTLTLDVSTGNTAFVTDDKIEFRLYQSSATSENYTASFANAGTLGVTTTSQIVGLYPYAMVLNIFGNVRN